MDRALVGASALWTVASLPWLTNAAVDLTPYFVILGAGAFLTLVMVITGGVRLIRKRASGGLRWAVLAQVVGWAVVAACLFTTVGLSLRLRMGGAPLLTLPASASTPLRAGLFTILEKDEAGPCKRFITTQDFLDHAGVVHCTTDAPPPRVGEDSYRHVYGGWWAWRRSW